MINLLSETKRKILNSKHQISDVAWVGSYDGEYAISWNKFEDIANIEYDNGYGAVKIATDLVVVFKDKSYLIRREYDGSEWWEYNHELIKRPNAARFSRIYDRLRSYSTLRELNKEMNE